MRIVNLSKFLDMPTGTVFCKYDPCCFKSINIFTDRMAADSRDFGYLPLFDVKAEDSNIHANVLLEAEETGESFKLDFSTTSRDGMFDDNQLFAIFEKEDVEGMIKVLQNSLIGKIEINDD